MLFNGWNNNLTFREGGVGAVVFFYCRQILQKKYLDPKCILNLQYIVVGYGVLRHFQQYTIYIAAVQYTKSLMLCS